MHRACNRVVRYGALMPMVRAPGPSNTSTDRASAALERVVRSDARPSSPGIVIPEGRSLVILIEQTAHMRGIRTMAADGNARLYTSGLIGQAIHALRSDGRYLLFRFDDFPRCVHFLLLDSYPIHTGLEREALTRDPTRRDDAAAA